MSEKIESLMSALDVTRKGARRIAEIVETGVDILLQEGFTSLTKRKIAGRLGISHGNVSYYFPTRESLWKAVIDHEFKEYYRKHYANFDADPNDADARFNEFVMRWIDEYEDREMRIFFSQILAFAEVNQVVAGLRDEIYEMFFDEAMARVRSLDIDATENELEGRVLTMIATLEGLHFVTAFRPQIAARGDSFKGRLVRQINAIIRGEIYDADSAVS